jgi:hypothetical protein
MSEEYKKRAMRSIEKYLVRETSTHSSDQQLPTPKGARSQPELEVQLKIQKHCRALGWYVFRVEAKASFSDREGLNYSQTQSGVSDLIGVLPNGVHISIEVKAPGRLSTLRENQRQHLIRVINHGAFGVCVDSVDKLELYYQTWVSSSKSKQVLLDLLPPEPKRISKGLDDLFD